MNNTQQPNSSCDVLIVGAGPTGLALGAALAKFGIQFRIIDKNASRSEKSKALGVQAGTLEALAEVFGPAVAEKFRSTGFTAKEAHLHLSDNLPIKIDLSFIPSEFNGILILEQSENERILEEMLNETANYVERECSLLSAVQVEGGVECLLRDRDGTPDTILAKYVVGCDGARSTVRESAGIAFHGETYTGDFLLGDLQVEWPFSHGHIRAFVSERGAVACFPMKGHRKYRLVLVLNTLSKTPSSEVSLEEFQAIAKYISGESMQLSEPVWMTRFRVHHRMAERFRSGSIFLAGDAAHIHSPAGGQGMNTGIQDALNLASKLNAVLRLGAPATLLENYQKQRQPVARAILRGTDLVFRGGILSENIFFKFARRFVLPRLIRLPFLQKRTLTAVSEVRIARQEIKIRKNEMTRPK